MKFLFDVNLLFKWTEWLKSYGIDAKHWLSIGHHSDPDEVIFQYASNNNFIIVTSDLDFGTLLSHSSFGRPSVIQIRVEDTLPNSLGLRLVATIKQFESELSSGAIVTI